MDTLVVVGTLVKKSELVLEEIIVAVNWNKKYFSLPMLNWHIKYYTYKLFQEIIYIEMVKLQLKLRCISG